MFGVRNMIDKIKKDVLNKPIKSCLCIFCVCLVFRIIEYLLLKTDETIISENFIHKIIGILILFWILKITNYKFADIGFSKKRIVKQLLCGIGLGVICFFIAYTVEYIVLLSAGKTPQLSIFAKGFSISGNETKHTELIFFILCIVFNIINVIMEEGMFRGLFIKIISNKEIFFKASLIVALLFGIWHFVMPLRSIINGEMTIMSALIIMIGYIILSGIMSIKWALLYKMTGSLWIGIGDHLLNNTITNLLHIVSGTGIDELQIVRIIFAQLISFIIVIILYRKNKKLKCNSLAEK